VNHSGAQAEALAAACLDANYKGEKKVWASDAFTALSPSQVEALCSVF